jgi:hypothetical protein
MKRSIFLALLGLALARPLAPCTWCTQWTNAANSSVPSDVATAQQMQAVDVAAGNINREYIEKFFPKALVLLYYVDGQMCPEAAYASLKEVISILTYRSWYYFKNKPKGFRIAEHWEPIIEQCRALCEYLEYAHVDLKTMKVSSRPFQDLANTISLRDYWNKKGLLDYFDFYAITIDYQVKMFNEAIYTSNLQAALEWAQMISFVVVRLNGNPARKLDGARYLVEYQNVVKRNDELIATLKRKIGDAQRTGATRDGLQA